MGEARRKQKQAVVKRGRDVLGTLMLGILSGHRRYAHVTALRGDAVAAQALGMQRIISEDALQRIDETASATWLRPALMGSVRDARGQLRLALADMSVLDGAKLCEYSVLVTDVVGKAFARFGSHRAVEGDVEESGSVALRTWVRDEASSILSNSPGNRRLMFQLRLGHHPQEKWNAELNHARRVT